MQTLQKARAGRFAFNAKHFSVDDSYVGWQQGGIRLARRCSVYASPDAWVVNSRSDWAPCVHWMVCSQQLCGVVFRACPQGWRLWGVYPEDVLLWRRV